MDNNSKKKVSELYLELLEEGVPDNDIVARLHNYVWSLYLDDLPSYDALLKTSMEIEKQYNVNSSHTNVSWNDSNIDDAELDKLIELEEALFDEEMESKLEPMRAELQALKKEMKEIKEKINDVLILDYLHKQVISNDDTDSGNNKGNNDSKDKK